MCKALAAAKSLLFRRNRGGARSRISAGGIADRGLARGRPSNASIPSLAQSSGKPPARCSFSRPQWISWTRRPRWPCPNWSYCCIRRRCRVYEISLTRPLVASGVARKVSW